MIRLARPMSTLDSHRTGGKRISQSTKGRARTGPPARGGARPSSSAPPRRTRRSPRPRRRWPPAPPAAEPLVGQRRRPRVAETSWQMSTSSRTGFKKRWRVLDQARPATARLGACRRPATRALTFEVRTRLVSARASDPGGSQQHARPRATRTACWTRRPTSCAIMSAPVGAVEALEQLRSRASIRSASASTSWSMPSRCSRPCTTSSAISSSMDTSCSTALRAATAGQITTSPSSRIGASPARRSCPARRCPESGKRPEGPGSSSMGKRQHVGRAALARNCSLSAAMVVLVDEEQRHLGRAPDPSAVEDPAEASATSAPRSTGWSCCSSAAKTLNRSPAAPASPFGHVVGVDDVGRRSCGAPRPGGRGGRTRCPRCSERIVLDPDQPRATARHVDLGHVAGDHALGAEPDAGQEHLHLLGRGVLGLVQDDERVVERPTPHEGERRHLDGPRSRRRCAPSGSSRS